jgi:hypothetical protein
MSSYKLEVSDVYDGPLTSKKGNVYYNQTAYLHDPDRKYPAQTTLYCPADPHGKPEGRAPGMYNVVPKPYVGQFDKLEFRFDLEPVAEAVKKAS